jgi:hypothetical protein
MMTAMKFRHELTYDAPMAAVGEMLMDAAFREEVCDRQHVLRHTVTITTAGGGNDVMVDQVQPAAGIPSFARRFVGDEINIVQQEHWPDLAAGTVEATIPGKPGQMSGTIRLAESGGVTTETVDMEITVAIPLVGGRIEGLIADLLRKALETEGAVGRDYLSR